MREMERSDAWLRMKSFIGRFERVVDSVEETTVKVRPIIDDVRIFTDKIARDPRQLGVKGALDRRSSGLGLKNKTAALCRSLDGLRTRPANPILSVDVIYNRRLFFNNRVDRSPLHCFEHHFPI